MLSSFKKVGISNVVAYFTTALSYTCKCLWNWRQPGDSLFSPVTEGR